MLNASKVLIAGSGHHAQADTPEEVVSALIGFFKEGAATS